MVYIVRIKTGTDIDKLIGGGIPKSSWFVVAGEPGTGKTILAISYAYEGLKEGDYVIYVTTEQTFKDILVQAETLGMDFSSFIKAKVKGFKIIDLFTLAKQARQSESSIIDPLSIHNLIRILKSILQEIPRDEHVRLVIDSISAFWADKPAMARKYSYELKLSVHRSNVTTLLTVQYAPTTGRAFGFGLEHIADGVLELWTNIENGRLVRYLVVRKMRFTDHDLKVHRYEITDRGIILLD